MMIERYYDHPHQFFGGILPDAIIDRVNGTSYKKSLLSKGSTFFLCIGPARLVTYIILFFKDNILLNKES